MDVIDILYDGDQTARTALGQTLEGLLKELPPREPKAVGAIVNGGIRELSYPLYADSSIRWLDYTSPNGHRIYKRSLIFVLLAACRRLFPERQLKTHHSLENGSYCQLLGETPLQQEEIIALEKEMGKIVEADLPIVCNELSQEDAVAFFTSQGKEDKASLIAMRQSHRLNLYTLDGIGEYFFGRMANRTGLLDCFQLLPFDEGMVLRLPAQKDTGFCHETFTQPRRLYATLREYREHARYLKVETVPQLNQVIQEDRFAKLSLVEEAIQERELHQIADSILADFPQVRLVLIAGPSCSGKTTFTQRLGIQFRALGIHPLSISLDDYFIDRDKTPLDEYGQKDYESIRALDLPLFNRHLEALIAGEEVQVPRYDFITGKRSEIRCNCRLDENKIILVEGIHGLNEELTAAIPQAQKRKIYISALTQLKMDAYTPIPSSDNRLYRRIIRDMRFRGHSAEQTIMIWNSVRRGEAKNIFPFQEEADYFFNSAFLHELAIIRPLVEPALEAIPSSSPAYLEARRLLRFIQYFLPAPADFTPNNSILQEFLGHSIFHNYGLAED